MEKNETKEKDVALVPYKEQGLDTIKEIVKEKEDTALSVILKYITAIESRKSESIVHDDKKELALMKENVVEIIDAARDFERNYTIPGKKRFKRVCRLRKALDNFEEQFEKKIID